MKGARVVVRCENCDRPKEMFQSIARTFRFCSKECKAESQRHEREICVCENCGEEYEKLPNSPNGGRFCSLECHRDWQRLENHPRHINGADLLDEIRRLENELGHPPSRSEMVNLGRYSAKPYYNHFGSWLGAIKSAGLEPDRQQKRSGLPDGHYGRGWQIRRKEIVRRDNHRCQDCGTIDREHRTKYGCGLHVHHRINAGLWENREDAHIDLNLVTLCLPCHGKRHAEDRGRF